MEGRPGKGGLRHYGGFDTLRMVAALSVVLAHSYALTSGRADEPRPSVGHFPIGFGRIGVAVFFVTSGFLVALSLDRVRTAATFARNRFLRIWPALTALVVLSVFVLGPLMTTRSMSAYFSSSVTERYFFKNLTMFFGAAYRLPGVFADQRYGAVNGSLWTLPYELWAYVAVLLLGMVGLLRRAYVPVALLVVALALFRFGTYDHTIPLNHSLLGLSARTAAELGSFFLLGVAVSRFASAFPLPRLVGPGVVLTAIAFAIGEPVLFILGFGALTIGLGTTNARLSAELRRLGDPSYGIYIFSFPLQQLLVHAGIQSVAMMFVVAAPISTAIGFLSWHLVESPALKRFKLKRPPARAPEAALGDESVS